MQGCRNRFLWPAFGGLCLGWGPVCLAADLISPPISALIAPIESHTGLCEELLQRSVRDQAVRKRLVELAQQKHIDFSELENAGPEATRALEDVRQTDSENTRWLKAIVAAHGWPTIGMVGREGARAAWLLIQHADRDWEFQKRCLLLMEQAPAGDVEAAHFAYLCDRVRLAEGKGQLYGTQLEYQGGKLVLCPVDDIAKLGERRLARGLPPIADYLASARSTYGESSQTR